MRPGRRRGGRRHAPPADGRSGGGGARLGGAEEVRWSRWRSGDCISAGRWGEGGFIHRGGGGGGGGPAWRLRRAGLGPGRPARTPGPGSTWGLQLPTPHLSSHTPHSSLFRTVCTQASGPPSLILPWHPPTRVSSAHKGFDQAGGITSVQHIATSSASWGRHPPAPHVRPAFPQPQPEFGTECHTAGPGTLRGQACAQPPPPDAALVVADAIVVGGTSPVPAARKRPVSAHRRQPWPPAPRRVAAGTPPPARRPARHGARRCRAGSGAAEPPIASAGCAALWGSPLSCGVLQRSNGAAAA